MVENYEEDFKIKPKYKTDDDYNQHPKNHKHHNDRDYGRDRHSPSQPSRHSSLSFNSNFENDSFDFSKRKSNSRLSFADEHDEDRHQARRKSANNSGLKLLLNSELSRARSSESLRSNKKESKFSDSDNELNDRKHRKDYRDEPDRHRNGSKEILRERSRSRHEKDERDEKYREKGCYFICDS